MHRWTVTSAPAEEPITLEEAKNHLKVDYTADDDLITMLIEAARQAAEHRTNVKLITQTITEKFDAFPSGSANVLQLSVPNVQQIDSINYIDADGNTQTFAADKYYTGKSVWPAFVSLKQNESWPGVSTQKDAVTVVYTVGFGSAADVPGAIKAAMFLIIADLYENRTDSVKRLPTASQFLLDQYWKGL